MIVGDSLQPLEGDQGYQSSQSLEDISSIGCQLQTMVINGRRAPPNTLRLPKDIVNSKFQSKHSYSDSDFPQHHSGMELDVSKISLWSDDDKCMVYISYTDKMASWVRSCLKPLIESWKYSEVILHEDEMIPGFAISNERQRLILQAHKVVLVVSRDYSNSPWCLYELQHAIQQEPALCRGRIIPILVDGCLTVPSIVTGVVALPENDRNFSLRLKKNIMEN